jgi:hypothetical protein
MFIDTPSGERIQQLSQVYLGFHEDFVYNPLIAKQQEKCLDINNIPEKWNNPPLIFCYSHRIQDLTKKLETIQNTCIFLFTNSDQNMTYDICKPLLEFDRIKHIFCQNIQFMHEKASFIPIGLANTQWSHGNPEFIKMVNPYFSVAIILGVLIMVNVHASQPMLKWTFFIKYSKLIRNSHLRM